MIVWSVSEPSSDCTLGEPLQPRWEPWVRDLRTRQQFRLTEGGIKHLCDVVHCYGNFLMRRDLTELLKQKFPEIRTQEIDLWSRGKIISPSDNNNRNAIDQKRLDLVEIYSTATAMPDYKKSTFRIEDDEDCPRLADGRRIAHYYLQGGGSLRPQQTKLPNSIGQKIVFAKTKRTRTQGLFIREGVLKGANLFELQSGDPAIHLGMMTALLCTDAFKAEAERIGVENIDFHELGDTLP
jgi:hypothetical protein